MEITIHEALALFLRQNPSYIVVKDDGTKFAYNRVVDKYYWQKESNKKQNGVYVARGLQQWYETWLRRFTTPEVPLEEMLPF
jgi:hypothetical protein